MADPEQSEFANFTGARTLGNVTSEFFRPSVNVCSETVLCTAERIGYAVAVPTICLLGILLNIFNLVVLSQGRFKESSYSYLTGLAVADLLSLFFFGVNGIGRGYYLNDPGWRAFEVYAYFPFGASTTTASVLLTVTVTIERFAFIYWPAESKAWCTKATAQRVGLAVWTGSIVINIPRFFILRVAENGKLEYTWFGQTAFYHYLSWSYFFCISLGSGVCLIILNVLLVVGIRRAGARRQSMQSRSVLIRTDTDQCTAGASSLRSNGEFGQGSQTKNDGANEPANGVSTRQSPRDRQREKDEATLTRTLVVIVCVFIIGETPSSFTSRSMVVALLGGDQTVLESVGYRAAVLISTLLVVSQHSVNFVVYCVFNRRFCDSIRQLLVKNCSGRGGGSVGRRGAALAPAGLTKTRRNGDNKNYGASELMSIRQCDSPDDKTIYGLADEKTNIELLSHASCTLPQSPQTSLRDTQINNTRMNNV